MNWTVLAAIATAGAAVATSIAAGFTAWMASATRKMAKATQQAADASVEAINLTKQELQLLEAQTAATVEQARVARLVITQTLTPLLVPVVPSTTRNSFDRRSDIPYVKVRSIDGTTRGLPANATFSRLMFGEPSEPPAFWILVDMKNVGSGPAVVSSQVLDASPSSVGAHFASNLLKGLNPMQTLLKAQTPVIAPGDAGLFAVRVDDPGDSIWRIFNDTTTHSTLKAINVTLNYQGILGSNTYSITLRFTMGPEQNELLPGQPVYSGYEWAVGGAPDAKE